MAQTLSCSQVGPETAGTRDQLNEKSFTVSASPARVGSTPGAHASPTSCFKSPAPFSTAAASGAASRSAFERSAARTPGEFSPQYVPSGAFAGGASETVRGQLDAPPLQSLHDLAPGSGGVSAATSQPAPSLAPSSLAPSQPASSEGGHWVTIFGYHSVAMVPQVLALLRPSGGQVVQQATLSSDTRELLATARCV